MEMVPRAGGSCNKRRNDEAGYHDPVAAGILDTISVVRVLRHPPEQWRVAQPCEYKLQGVEDEERNAKDDGSQDIQEGLVGFLLHCSSSFQGRRRVPATLAALFIICILYRVERGLYTIMER